MAKKYTLSEAAQYLGVEQSEVEDLIASGDISFEIVNDEYRIPEELLLKIRMIHRKKRKPGKPPVVSLIDDAEFVSFLEDLIQLRTNEIFQKLEDNTRRIRADLDSTRKFIVKKIDSTDHNGGNIPELDKKTIEKIEDVITQAVEKSLKTVDLKNIPGSGSGNSLSADNIKDITESIESVLDQKLKTQQHIIDMLNSIEERVASSEDTLLTAINSLQEKHLLEDFSARMDLFMEEVTKHMNQYAATLQEDRVAIKKLIETSKNIRADISGSGDSPDITKVLAAINEIDEGQKKARKIMLDLNVNLQKAIIGKFDEIKKLSEQAPQAVREIQSIVPILRDTVESKLSRIEKIHETLEVVKNNFTVEGQGNMLVKLDEVMNTIRNTDIGNVIPQISEQLQAFGNSVEHFLAHMYDQQQASLYDRLDQMKLPEEILAGITEQFDDIESSFRKLTSSVDSQFAAVSSAMERIGTTGGGTGGNTPIQSGSVEDKLNQIQNFLTALQAKFDFRSMLDMFQESVDDTLNGLRESQESFQKIIVNLNINNQKALVEKLEQLDRLNELVNLRDNVDEIAEQMATFEAIMADINQLVDERLQTLTAVNENVGNLAGLVGLADRKIELPENLTKQLEQMRNLVDVVQERFSMESLLTAVKSTVNERIEELKQTSEAAQKVLVNLNVNTQKNILDRLDEISSDMHNVREVKEHFQMLETIIPNISELIDIKLKKLEDFKYKTDTVIGDVGTADTLARLHRIVENEAKAIRHSVEASQKIIVNMGMNNQKILIEKLNASGLSGKAIDEIVEKNRDMLRTLIGNVDPGSSIASLLDNITIVLDSMKESVNTGKMLGKISEHTTPLNGAPTREFTDAERIMSEISGQLRNEIADRISGIESIVNELKTAVKPENIISHVTDIIIEGNEILKENQVTILNHQMKSHQEVLDQIQEMGALKSAVNAASTTGDVLPLLEKLLENQVSAFKKDIEGAHKVLINLNVNLQKQLLSKIKEILAAQPVNLDTGAVVQAIDQALEEKLADIKVNQEALLSVNLNTQKALKEKLEELAKIRSGGVSPGADSIADDLNSLLPLIEKIFADKIRELQASFLNTQHALDKLSGQENNDLLEKLTTFALTVSAAGGAAKIGALLPEFKSTIEETTDFLTEFRHDLEAIKKNVQLQDPDFLDKKLDSLKHLCDVASIPEELIGKMEQSIEDNLGQHRETLRVISQKIDYLYDILKDFGKEHDSAELGKLQLLFSARIEETRELEQQLIHNFKQMQSMFKKEISSDGTRVEESGVFHDILKTIEETRREQEGISQRVERLSELISILPQDRGGDKSTGSDDEQATQLRRDNTKLMQAIENLKRENFGLQKQLKSARSLAGGDVEADEQLRAMMGEKDRLLEECYREKVDLREQLEKEKRDKYEIIQRYETEKKELIDSLALERIQREKDRAELELLRADSRKKKWW